MHTARNSALLEKVRIILLCILPEIQPYWRRSGLYCFAYCQKFSLTGEGQDYTALHTARNLALLEKVRIILLCILPEIQPYRRKSGLYCFAYCQKFSIIGEGQDYTALHAARNSALPFAFLLPFNFISPTPLPT